MQITQILAGKIDATDHAQRFNQDEELVAEMAGSIRRLGLLEPVIVKKNGEGFTVVAGHTRYKACLQAALTSIPCIVRDMTDEQLREITFAENFFRKDLTPLELAVAIAKEHKEQRMTIDQLAAGFRKSPNWVKRMIAITQWPEEIQEAMHVHGMKAAVAANLAAIPDEKYRNFLLRNAIESGATSRTTASWRQAFEAQVPGTNLDELVEGNEGEPLMPAVPQTLCIGCKVMHRVDGLSHVPLCPSCISIINKG